MKTFARNTVGLLVELSLSLVVAGPASAREVPTGAERLVEKVQTRIAISQVRLMTNLAPIQENAAAALAKTRE